MIKKVLLASLFVLVFIFIWRPIRVVINDYLIRPLVSSYLESNETQTQEVYLVPTKQLNYIIYLPQESLGPKAFYYRVMGGLYFLLAAILLVFINPTPAQSLLHLFYLQLILILLTSALFLFGLYVSKYGIYLMEIINIYIDPALNLGFAIQQSPMGKQLRFGNKKAQD